jgi:DNA-binding MarR family transcriptional regulator
VTISTKIPGVPDLGGPGCTTKPDIELENVDSLTAEVFGSMHRVMHLNRLVMARTMAVRGMQYPEVFALALLSRRDGISQRDLSKSLHLSQPRVSMILRALEEDGCIDRRPDETDRRLTRVFITDEGRRREKEHRNSLGLYVERTMGALPEDDRRELSRLLDQLADRMVVVLRAEQDSKPSEGGTQIP